LAVALAVCLAAGWAAAQRNEVAEARVAAQAGAYTQALAALEQILEQRPNDLEARVEYARVLSWARRYEQSLQQFEATLKLAGNNVEAQVGRARVLYWMGRLKEAARSLSGMEGEEARLLLAEIERARGHNDRALAALQSLSGGGARLRESIRKELRPVLHLGYAAEDDREIPEMGAASTVRASRWVTSLEFSPQPDVRMKWSTTVTQGSTSSPGVAIYGPDALAVASMAEIKFRLAHWLEVNLGGGVGTAGDGSVAGSSRHQHFLYSIHPVMRRRGLRVDVAAARSLGDYTPLAIHNDVVEQREGLAASHAWKRLKLGGEYWHAKYRLRSPDSGARWETAANGGAAFVMPVLLRGERVLVEAGARYEAYGFEASAAGLPSPGFFTPGSYQRYGAAGHFWWHPQRRLETEVKGLLGRQRFFLFDDSGPHGFDVTGSLETKVTLEVGRVRPFLSYAYSSAPSSASAGGAEQYSVHVFGAGVSIRF